MYCVEPERGSYGVELAERLLGATDSLKEKACDWAGWSTLQLWLDEGKVRWSQRNFLFLSSSIWGGSVNKELLSEGDSQSFSALILMFCCWPFVKYGRLGILDLSVIMDWWGEETEGVVRGGERFPLESDGFCELCFCW